jgi:pyruvate kinase
VSAIKEPRDRRKTGDDDEEEDGDDEEEVSYEGGFSCDISGSYDDVINNRSKVLGFGSSRKQQEEEQRPRHILDNCRMTLDFKTKIICTLGPSSRTVEQLENLLMTGMSVARFNFSHGSHEYHQETLDNLRQASENTGLMCAVFLDTKGPEIRTGMLENGEPVQLHQGEQIVLTTDYEHQGNAKKIAVSYRDLAKDVKTGSKILCADGSITLKVLSTDVNKGEVLCRCENSAMLGERKNMNLPRVNVNLPTITEKDKDDILNWGVKNNVDFIAASFVRKGSDIDTIREVLGEHSAAKIGIVAKVENMEGLDNFEDIVRKSDGIMVARGDLGMEIRMEQIFLAQKRMIKRCNEEGKPVITATQMLESMTGAPRPTRAEATDVANAVIDGTDCVMLSGETAAGKYPLDACAAMADICGEAEAYAANSFVSPMTNSSKRFSNFSWHVPHLESVAAASAQTADEIGAKVIITLSKSGNTSRLISKYRPNCPIIAVSIARPGHDHANSARRLLLSRGVVPILENQEWRGATAAPQEILANAIVYVRDVLKLVKTGDLVVGVHRLHGDPLMKVVEVP